MLNRTLLANCPQLVDSSLNSLSTEQYTKLLNQLQAWCRQDRGRQSLLATKLNVSRQLVSAWLNGSRTLSLDEYFQIQEIIEQSAGPQFQKENPMSLPIFEPPAEPRGSTRDPNEPKTLGSAKEMLADLRAQLAQLKAATPPAAPKAKAPQAPAAAAPRPAVRLPEPPATKPPPTFDMLDPKTWTGKQRAATDFPANCDSPKAIAEYLSTLSTEVLRSHLNSAGATSDTKRLQQKLTFAELQKRKSSR
jgi:transcriptional regulator with XRE-family HTH domain